MNTKIKVGTNRHSDMFPVSVGVRVPQLFCAVIMGPSNDDTKVVCVAVIDVKVELEAVGRISCCT